MALYLPFLAALLLGDDAIGSILAGVIAVTVVIVVLAIALRIEVGLSRVVFSRSDEALLLSILGFAFLIAGLAEVGKFSAAVGALLAGIILSGPAARSADPRATAPGPVRRVLLRVHRPVDRSRARSLPSWAGPCWSGS